MRGPLLWVVCISTWCAALALHAAATVAQERPAVAPIVRAASVSASSTANPDLLRRFDALRSLVTAALESPVSTSAGATLSHLPEVADLEMLLGKRFRASPQRSKDDAQPLPVQTTPMPVTGDARAPFGWRQFCGFYPSECRQPMLRAERMTLDAKRWRELETINAQVNRRIIPMSDADHHGTPEHWDYPMDGFGDCEDYALLKRRMLLLAGWPRQAVLMTVVRDAKGDGHAVLTVVTDRGDFVLDNQVRPIRPWTSTGYRFVKRQAAEDPNLWVGLGDVDTALVASAGSVTPRN